LAPQVQLEPPTLLLTAIVLDPFPGQPPGAGGEDLAERELLDRRVFLQKPFRPKLFLETVARPVPPDVQKSTFFP
jgi:hypothetical protein